MGIKSKPLGSVRRILIVGLLPRQFEAVARRIGDRAELEHCSSQNGMGRVMQALHGDAYAVVNTKFVSHTHIHHVNRARCKMCFGGETTVVRAVEELLD